MAILKGNLRTMKTVDGVKGGAVLGVFNLLAKLDVIELGSTKHSFSPLTSRGISMPATKPHWIPLAVVSLSIEFMEIIALPRRK